MIAIRDDAPQGPARPAGGGRPQRLGYVLGAFPVLSETFVSGEIGEIARRGALGPVFVFDRRDDVRLDALVADHVRPVAGLSPAPGMTPAGAVGGWALLRGLPVRRRLSVLRHAGRIAWAAQSTGCSHLHAHFGGGAALHGLVAARLAGVGFSLSLHSGRFERNFDGPDTAAILMRGADAVVAATGALASAARAAGARCARVVPCGVDLGRFRPPPGVAHNGRLLFVGRLIDCKGAETALAALARLAPFARPAIDLVGDGPDRPALAAAADRLGVSARFLGARPNDWFAQEGGGYMGLVAPFRQGRDGQVDSAPVVLKEALALGLPVITTDLPGPAEIVGRAAQVVPADDPEALSDAIARLAAQTAGERARLARAARARALEFALTRQADAILDLAAEVAA